ncbi:MAG: ATP-dependent Clp protease proteolytic subunit [Lachnospiraceae bacterium]|nr:ATP-dependent Clp protease proteolytic subunit [Lachnospiraceae bacterium]
MEAYILHESSRGIDKYTPESALLKKRVLFFTEEVTSESSDRLIQYLLYLDMDAPGEEITLCINSPGGEVVSGLAAYDTIRSLKSPMRTVCIGTAASMGSILFLAGEKREMLPHTKIMIHDPLIAGLSGSKRALELEKEAAQLMETRATTAAIIAERSGRTLEEVYEKTKEDCYMTSEEAVGFGIATAVTEGILFCPRA